MDSEALLDRFYTALKALDAQALAACVSGAFVLNWQGSSAIPWSGTWHGTAGLLAFVAALNRHVEVVSVERLHALANNEVTVVVIRGHWRMRATSHEITATAANLFAIADGKIDSYTVLNNSAAFAEALAGG